MKGALAPPAAADALGAGTAPAAHGPDADEHDVAEAETVEPAATAAPASTPLPAAGGATPAGEDLFSLGSEGGQS